jgi:carbonic anhydrase
MFNEGGENSILQRIWNQMPTMARQKVKIKTDLPYAPLIPKNKDYYRFNGSFTTPPCTEGVRWVMLKEILTASKDQISQFLEVMGHPNNRNIQPTRARIIVD